MVEEVYRFIVFFIEDFGGVDYIYLVPPNFIACKIWLIRELGSRSSDHDNRMILGFVKFVMPIEIHSMEHKTSDFVGEVREKLVKKLTRWEFNILNWMLLWSKILDSRKMSELRS